MISMYRSKGSGNEDAIGFHKNGIAPKNNDKIEITLANGTKVEVKIGNDGVKDIQAATAGNSYVITLADVLNISGEYDAKLEFIYPGNCIHSNVAEADYNDKLVEKDSGGMFVIAGSSIEFTYEGKTEKLTKEEIEKLIKVA